MYVFLCMCLHSLLAYVFFSRSADSDVSRTAGLFYQADLINLNSLFFFRHCFLSGLVRSFFVFLFHYADVGLALFVSSHNYVRNTRLRLVTKELLEVLKPAINRVNKGCWHWKAQTRMFGAAAETCTLMSSNRRGRRRQVGDKTQIRPMSPCLVLPWRFWRHQRASFCRRTNIQSLRLQCQQPLLTRFYRRLQHFQQFLRSQDEGRVFLTYLPAHK